jgi:hypothetical protein
MDQPIRPKTPKPRIRKGYVGSVGPLYFVCWEGLQFPFLDFKRAWHEAECLFARKAVTA